MSSSLFSASASSCSFVFFFFSPFLNLPAIFEPAFFIIFFVSTTPFFMTGDHMQRPYFGGSCLPHHFSKNIVCSILYFGGISGTSSAYPIVKIPCTFTCSGRLHNLRISSSSKAPTQHAPNPREWAVKSMFCIAAAAPCTV